MSTGAISSAIMSKLASVVAPCFTSNVQVTARILVGVTRTVITVWAGLSVAPPRGGWMSSKSSQSADAANPKLTAICVSEVIAKLTCPTTATSPKSITEGLIAIAAPAERLPPVRTARDTNRHQNQRCNCNMQPPTWASVARSRWQS